MIENLLNIKVVAPLWTSPPTLDNNEYGRMVQMTLAFRVSGANGVSIEAITAYLVVHPKPGFR